MKIKTTIFPFYIAELSGYSRIEWHDGFCKIVYRDGMKQINTNETGLRILSDLGVSKN